MLKGNGKNIFVIIAIFILTLSIFIIGVNIFQPNIPYNTSFIDKQQVKLFDKLILSTERENWLIPLGTFFSALSALATVYLIWLQQQTIKNHDLEVYTERIISHFFILLNNHRTIVNNLKFTFDSQIVSGRTVLKPDPPATGYNAIKFFIYALRISLSDINYVDIDYYVPDNEYSKLKSYKVIRSICNIKNDKKLPCLIFFEDKLKITFDILDEHTSYCLSQYFNNIYIMIKLINENKFIFNVEDYMKTLRAEFTQDEFLLVYYYAFICKEGEKKNFKKLIEETCFFKDLYKKYLDCNPDSIHVENSENGTPFILYAPSAFTPD